MHIEDVHFDEVFDAQPGTGDFSFRSGGRTNYAVKLRRRLVPQAGSRYLVAFGEAGNWSTVLGWLDPRTARTTLKTPTWLALLDEFGMLVWFAPFFLAGALLFGGVDAALAVLGLICLLTGLRAWRLVVQGRRVRRSLREAQHAVTARVARPAA